MKVFHATRPLTRLPSTVQLTPTTRSRIPTKRHHTFQLFALYANYSVSINNNRSYFCPSSPHDVQLYIRRHDWRSFSIQSVHTRRFLCVISHKNKVKSRRNLNTDRCLFTNIFTGKGMIIALANNPDIIIASPSRCSLVVYVPNRHPSASMYFRSIFLPLS